MDRYLTGDISSKYQLENGSPQGNIIGPMLFIIMINDNFSSIDKSSIADDVYIWKGGKKYWICK